MAFYRFEHDVEHDVWEMLPNLENLQINSEEALVAWREGLTKLFEDAMRKAGGPIDMMIDVTGFHLDPSFATHYGKQAKQFAVQYTKSMLRYGATDGMTAAVVHFQAVINRYPSNLFKDRDAALAALKKIRQLELVAGT